MSAADLLRRRIEETGPVSFRDFMEEALYGEEGYYTRGGGPGRDFRTGPEMHPAFAEALANLFIDAGISTVVEVGAGAGAFAGGVTEAYRERGRDLRYVAVDRSGAARERLEGLPGVRVEGSMEGVKPFSGVLFSNELLDAIPVHVVEVREGLKEVYVDFYGGEFVEVLRRAPREVREYFDWLAVDLPEGFRTEVNLGANWWLEEVAPGLRRGLILTVDYGGPSYELYAPRRRGGTVMCFRRGTAHENPYVDVGRQDITSRVNFTAIATRGEELGLETLGLYPQGPFLQVAGMDEIVERERSGRTHRDFLRWFVPVRRMLMPGGMGETHRVLVQTRDWSFDEWLEPLEEFRVPLTGGAETGTPPSG
ncbi:MAG: hypothetical protein MAG715_00476 [Methanonatronarchaeales archaeon]|nr:hypothetical protein [Methanonatronarchaeales archaeon]